MSNNTPVVNAAMPIDVAYSAIENIRKQYAAPLTLVRTGRDLSLMDKDSGKTLVTVRVSESS